jgi:hypothetical protein
MRAIERRLALVESRIRATSWADRQAAHHRQSLRARDKLHDLIRERLRVMGIDPAIAVSLQRGGEAAAELAEIPDTVELQAADEAIVRADCGDGNDVAHQFYGTIEQMAARIRDEEHQLDLAKASLAELLAFCVAVEMEAWGEC